MLNAELLNTELFNTELLNTELLNTELLIANYQLKKVRYNNVERHHRFCEICNLETVGDEYHYLFECNNEELVELRKRCVSNYYRVRPNMYTFIEFMSSFSNITYTAINCSHEVSQVVF